MSAKPTKTPRKHMITPIGDPKLTKLDFGIFDHQNLVLTPKIDLSGPLMQSVLNRNRFGHCEGGKCDFSLLTH